MAQQFPILSFEEANPSLAAAQSGMSLAEQLQKLKAGDMAAKYQKPTLEESLKQAKLQNEIAANTAQYAPQLSAEDLKQQQYKSIIDAITAQYAPEKQATDIASTQAKTQWLPYQAIGSYASGLGSYTNSLYNSNPTTALFRTLATPQGESLYEQNPQFASAVADSLANTAMQSAGGGGGGSRQPMALPTLAQTLSGTPNAQASFNYQPGQSGMQGQQRPSIFSPQDIAASQAATGNVLTRREIPTAILNQQYYGNTTSNLIDQADDLIPSVSKYAGPKGKAKLAADATSSMLGNSNPDYENYKYFFNEIVPTMTGEVRKHLGANATQEQEEQLRKLSKLDYWTSNPEMAKKQWDFYKKMIRGSVGGAVSLTPRQAQAQLKQGVINANKTTTTTTNNDPLGIR